MRLALPVAVIGAGFGGLAAAMRLAARGCAVTVFEAMPEPGGKARAERAGPHALEAGPTVFTLKPVFDSLFAEVGADFDKAVKTTRLGCLARHFWPDGSQLDLYADHARSTDAIAAFAGPKAAADFRRFTADAKAMFDVLDHSFMRRAKPGPVELARIAGLSAMLRIRPFTKLWDALGEYFPDPRLRQLFGRYATYCGSNPFLAPATLMLIAHAEMEGVWAIDGGLPALAKAMAREFECLGGKLRCQSRVTGIEMRNGRVAGVVLENGEACAAEAVVVNADTEALCHGLLGEGLRDAVPARPKAMRSLSAITISFAGHVSGPGLPMHNVFFSRDYAREFRQLAQGALPDDPTLYLCALDRRDSPMNRRGGEERFLALINAPPRGDDPTFDKLEPQQCQARIETALSRHGVRILPGRHPPRTMTPHDFAALFPGSGGALYGRATHGAMASFQRPGARTRIAGLYCAGGSVHPGAGVPMVTIAGSLAAEALLTDLASTSRLHPVAMPGGISTPSATMAGTP
ncbi:MAG: CrtD protein [Methylobacterium sp.]|nr:MAG: CrtD protein [Methylobacterium sp.]